MCSWGWGGRNPGAKWDPFVPQSDLTHGIVTASVPFIIESEAVMPWCYLALLGVLHLFVHLGEWSQQMWLSFSFHHHIMSQELTQKSVCIHCPSYWPRMTWRLLEIVSVSFSAHETDVMLNFISFQGCCSYIFYRSRSPSSRHQDLPSGDGIIAYSFLSSAEKV